jgi:hypothetical protein
MVNSKNSKFFRLLKICLFCVGRNINYFVLKFYNTVGYVINIDLGFFFEIF